MISVRFARLSRMALLLALWLVCAFPSLAAEAASVLEATQTAFRQIHAQVAPAVVSINSQIVTEPEFDPFEFFFGTPRSAPQTRSTSGSGVIIRPQGIVLTNSHVVRNATKVTVQLPGSEKHLPAEVVQTDPRTDLAIVRITEEGTYPVAKLGNADTVRVGDWAIAFGSPFRLPSTMTIGVISATGRQLPGPGGRDYLYRDLLQTDASINPGNSGGPLVNILGEVIGINFMIFSPGESAGSVGIGFAIPINARTMEIIETLAAGRALERGRLGVYVKDLDAAMRDAFGVKEGGAFIDSVIPGQAADKAGIKAEDVIIAVNETRVIDREQFVSLIERLRPETTVTLTIVREGKEQKVTAVLGSDTPVVTLLDARNAGLTVETLTPEIAAQLGMHGVTGVLVTGIARGGAAEAAGLRPRDLILRVGARNVQDADAFWKTVSDAMSASQHGVLLRVRRGDRVTTLTLPKITPEKK